MARLKIVMNVTRGYLDQALAETNAQFDHNIQFNQIYEYSANWWRVTLSVIQIGGPGSLYTRPTVTGSAKPIRSACWHVQKAFAESLPDWLPEELVTEAPIIDGVKIRIGDDWYNRRGMVFPEWMQGTFGEYNTKDLCRCDPANNALQNPFLRQRR